jgi:hypothetical protein
LTEDVKWNTDEALSKIDRIVERKLVAMANQYRRIIAELFRSAKHGRIYGKHRASGAGEPPAIDTGALAKSVVYEVMREGDEISVGIGPSIQGGRSKIAGWLEFGTSKIQPRPAWRPALDQLVANGDASLKE